MSAKLHIKRRAERPIAWLRLIAALAVALLLSDLPEVLVEICEATVDCCAGECEGADDQGHCPPDCQYGACANTVAATLPVASQTVAPAELIRTVSWMERTPVLGGFSGDVFHPPRA